ncbi:MAG: hypothetical protein WC310_04410 [Patescibacteria group bacterium]|jgi:hypothetical protein
MNKRKALIKITGILFLVIGLFSLFFVPVEFTSFYAFSEGGNYHYDGFGFGSLMFAFIIFNAMAYFVLACLGIPLGIGNISLKKWGYNLSVAVFRALLILGLALLASVLFSFDLLKVFEPNQLFIILLFILLFFIVLPYFLIRFYKNPNTIKLFKSSDVESYFAKQSPGKLTIILLNFFWILLFYLLLFFKSAFPLFGEFVFKKEGTHCLSVAIFILFILTYLLYNNKYYSKYWTLGYYLALFTSFVMTFLKHTTNDFINLLNLPVYEVEKVVPAFWIPAGINLVFFFGLLILIQIFLIFKIKK